MRRLLFVLVAVAACGDDSGVRHLDAHVDSPPLPDGPTPDALPQAVKLIATTAGGVPNPGVHVYFQNADSSVVLATVTDASGAAQAVMAAGGYVTAINPYTLPLFGNVIDDVETFAGVKPGDVLRLDQRSVPVQITVNITAPPDDNLGVVGYLVYASCSNGANQLTAPDGSGVIDATGQVLLTDCNGTADIMIVTTDDANSPIDYIFAPNTAVADQADLDFTAMAYTQAASRAYTYNNTPALAASIGIHDALVTVRGIVYQQDVLQDISAGPPVNFTLEMPAFTGAFDVVATSESPGGVQSARNILDWAPYAATYTLDYEAHLVPDLLSFPTFDTTAHALSWTESGGTLPAQFVLVKTSASRSSVGRSWNWNITAPHATQVVFPTLPTDLFDYNVNDTDGFNVFGMISANVPGGYDAARPQILSDSSQGPGAFVNPTPGFVSYAELQNNTLAARGRHKH